MELREVANLLIEVGFSPELVEKSYAISNKTAQGEELTPDEQQTQEELKQAVLDRLNGSESDLL
jgi:hypothetical protein